MAAYVGVLVLVGAAVVVVLLAATDWLRLELSRLTAIAGLLACTGLGDDWSQTGALSVSAVVVRGDDWLALCVLTCLCSSVSDGAEVGSEWVLSLARFAVGADAGEQSVRKLGRLDCEGGRGLEGRETLAAALAFPRGQRLHPVRSCKQRWVKGLWPSVPATPYGVKYAGPRCFRVTSYLRR